MNTVDSLLSCGCWKRLRIDKAVKFALETCPRHGETYDAIGLPFTVYIVKFNSYEWHVRCQEPFCRFGRWFGQSEGSARRANGLHATKLNHLGGVNYDRVTWDGKGSIYRGEERDRSQRGTKPQPPPERKLVKLAPPEYPEPPF